MKTTTKSPFTLRLIASLLLIVTLFPLLCSCNLGSRKDDYARACALLSTERYHEAAEIFLKIEGYKDSNEKLYEIYYLAENMVKEERDYDKAAMIFATLASKNFEDSIEYAKEILLIAVRLCLYEERYDDADAIVDQLSKCKHIDEYEFSELRHEVYYYDSTIFRAENLIASYIVGFGETDYGSEIYVTSSESEAVEACQKLREYYSKFYTIKEYHRDDGDFKGYEAGASEDDLPAITVYNFWYSYRGITVSYRG